jgi:multidrug efflux pump subunit AcrA (membrane-fusion protein)
MPASESPPIHPADVFREPGSVTEEIPLASPDQLTAAIGAMPAGRGRRTTRRVIALVVVLAAAGVGVAIANPFTSGGAGGPGAANTTPATGIYTVARQDLSSQTQVPATLGYAGSYTIVAPSGASAQDVAQAQQTVTEDQQTLTADQTAATDAAAADNQAIAAAQNNVHDAQSALSSDRATESQACAGTGASTPACSQDAQKVSSDMGQLSQAQQQLATAQSTATGNQNQNQAKLRSDETKLQGDHATLASLRATAANPGTTYTSLPSVGDVLKEDQAVYSLNSEPVPLLYGSIPAYRAFSVGMSDGADVGELTQDLVALGYGAGLTRSNHYSSATTAAVERWQRALGLPATGEILLGQVVFEPGPIRVTSVTASVGAPVGGGGGGGSSSGGGGDGTVLSATSTVRQVAIALDASQQSEVAVGDKVTITLPDNQITPGVISSVGTVATTPPSSGSGGSGSSSPTITVLVNPTDPAATGTWDQAPVNVTITTGAVTNALVVPVDALLAQPGGRYAVEVVDADGVHRLVPVNLGLFDDDAGLVEVSGSELATGQRVVVPSL